MSDSISPAAAAPANFTPIAADRTRALAAWAMTALVNRTDVWGGYLPLDERDTEYVAAGVTRKTGRSTTHPRRQADRGVVCLTADVLERHFAGAAVEHVAGLHSTSADNTSRWGAIDIDRHGDDGPGPETTEAAARHWYRTLSAAGFSVLLTDSNGKGGYHLLVPFDRPVRTAHLHGLLSEIVADHAAVGLPNPPETFPKQPALAPGRFGNWLRLPGRHHTTDHRSRVWDGSAWRDWADGIDVLLDAPLTPAGRVLDRLRPRIGAYAAKVPHGGAGTGRDDRAFQLACFLVRDLWLLPDDALEILSAWDAGNTPPKGDDRLREVIASAAAYGTAEFGCGLRSAPRVPPAVPMTESTRGRGAPPGAPPAWPDPAGPEAYTGLAGRLVHLIAPASEADPAALLVQILVAFGNAIGRTAHFEVDGAEHFANEFAVVVGDTAKARKGTSWGWVRRLFFEADPTWGQDRVASGLSSGEGVIWAVRDPIYTRERSKKNGLIEYEEVLSDPGVADKRLLAVESEYATVLKQTERQGNIISAVMRQAWDGHDLRTLTKNTPARASGAHISLIGHITAEELRHQLTANESANGFANRHLWVCARRSKLLPEGGTIDPAASAAGVHDLTAAIAFARTVAVVRRDAAARELWCDVYGELSDGRPGRAGAVLSRSEAHVMRLAMMYALMDQSAEITAGHLLAALALWDYTERSVEYLFGGAAGRALASEVERLLSVSAAGLTRTEIQRAFSGHRSSREIGEALDELARQGRARSVLERTGGRSAERWFACRVDADRAGSGMSGTCSAGV